MSSTSWESTLRADSIQLAPRPAPATARLVQFCCQRLLGVEPDFAEAFHQELCGLTPRTSLPAIACRAVLSSALAHGVLWAALTRDPADSVEGRIRALAADHHARGFPDDAYPGLCHALLRSVRGTLPSGWSSELSSCWVSYALWLQPHLEQGACSAPDLASGTADEPPVSLDVIFGYLRSRYFAGQDRALNSICTRVMLRTGADLRAPRPEQHRDPQVIAEVMESLLLMGFAPVPGLPVRGSGPRSVPDDQQTGSPEGQSAVPDQKSAPGRRHLWGLLRHRKDWLDQSSRRPPLT
jgi:hypothetical protein